MRVDRTSGPRSGILEILSSRRQALKGAAAASALAFPLIRTGRAAAQDATTVTWFAGRDTTGFTPTRSAHESDEVITVERLPLAEAVRRAASGEITDAKSVCALLRASCRRG